MSVSNYTFGILDCKNYNKVNKTVRFFDTSLNWRLLHVIRGSEIIKIGYDSKYQFKFVVVEINKKTITYLIEIYKNPFINELRNIGAKYVPNENKFDLTEGKVKPLMYEIFKPFSNNRELLIKVILKQIMIFERDKKYLNNEIEGKRKKDIQKEVNKLVVIRKNLKFEIDELKLDIKNINSKNAEYFENEKKYEKTKKDTIALEKEIFSVKQENEELIGEKKELNNQRNKLNIEINKSKDEKQEIEKTIKNKKLQLEKIRKEDNSFRMFIEKALEQKETLDKEINERDIIKKQLKDETNKLKQEKEELKEKIKDLETQLVNNKKQPNNENKENTKTDSDPVQNILKKIGVSNIVAKLKECKTKSIFHIEEFKNHFREKGLFYSEETIRDLHYSVLSNRLTILAGQPGCGKSKLMQTFINFMSKDIPKDLIKHTYSFIPVKPEWTDPSFLIGCYNYLQNELEVTEFQKICYLAEQCPKIPFYICLDEFNIARPENYFADFLSLRELDNRNSKKKITFQNSKLEIKLRDNIHFFATINTDATTFELSPKVLDRSNIIELKPEKIYIKKLIKNFKSKHLSFNDSILKFEEILVAFIEKWEKEDLLNQPLPISYRSVKSALQLLITNSQDDISIIDYFFSKSILIKLQSFDDMDEMAEKYKNLLESIKVDFRENKLLNSVKKVEKIINGASGQTG